MRSRTTFLLFLGVCLVTADALAAQRRRGRGRRGQRPTPQAVRPPEPEKTKPVEKWVAIQGADVHIGTGTVMRRATVLLGDDKIHGVGHELEIPEDAERVDATGMVVSPGFVIVKCSGLGAPRNPEGKFRDEVNPFEPQMKLGLAAGITTFCALSGNGTDTPGGKSAAIKLSYGSLDGMVARENPVYTMRVPLSPQKLRDLRRKVREIREWQTARDAASGGRPPRAPQGSETLIAVIEGKSKLWITTGGGGGGRRGGGGGAGFGNEQIRQAMEIADLFGTGVVLDGPVTAWSIPDEIAATGSAVIWSPRSQSQPDPGRPDVTGSNLATAAILSDAGVPVAVTTPSGRFGGGSIGTGGILGQDLNTPHVDAAFAVRGGLDNRRGLRTITLDAAKIIGIDDRVGSIEVGKDADLLILDGDPLHYKTFVQTAIVNGKVVYEKDKEPFYSHIKR